MEGHVARQITSAMCRDYDLILAMEKRHVASICDQHHEVAGQRPALPFNAQPLRRSIRFNSGPVIAVVTSAMITSTANSRSPSRPSS
ncbi:hypothetical protein AAHH21_04760 [Stenotrophomonas sp. BSUC-16]|uniref:arsenate reductase/protein-tyrosine-phosphatase family protein n=1 Tax=Stenotrophomonas sp. BSUC-16 TaxID=3156074 RepID=UPI0033927F71